MKTTMQAPLNEREETSITEAWRQLCETEAPTLAPGDEIARMLGHATSLIERAHRLRKVISDASYYAERRAFPDARRAVGRPRKVPGPFDLATKILELGITEDEVQSFLSGRKPQ